MRPWSSSIILVAPRAVAVLALAAVAAAPTPAQACDPYIPQCEGWSAIELLQAAAIPAEGVLVLRVDASGVSEGSLAALSATVTDAGDQVIDGALEFSEDPLALVWRPAAALTPGMTYDLHIDVDNTVFAGNECELPAGFSVDASFSVDDAALPEPFVPTIDSAAELTIVEYLQFETMLCCNGAEPYIGSCSTSEWGGFCAATEGDGRIDATFTADLAAFAATGDQIGLRGFDLGTGEARASASDKAPCVTPNAFVWATGEAVLMAEICAGENLVDQAGPQQLDPLAALQAECGDTPVNCADASGQWDSSQCEPWDGWVEDDSAGESATGGGGSGEGGCGCRSAGGDAGAIDNATGFARDWR
ncbi:MAG: hypothetical protein KC486_28900, partial [Myxococcales bacterium]|nr:hypothetical protein [Myxococcales bacterium]